MSGWENSALGKRISILVVEATQSLVPIRMIGVVERQVDFRLLNLLIDPFPYTYTDTYSVDTATSVYHKRLYLSTCPHAVQSLSAPATNSTLIHAAFILPLSRIEMLGSDQGQFIALYRIRGKLGRRLRARYFSAIYICTSTSWFTRKLSQCAASRRSIRCALVPRDYHQLITACKHRLAKLFCAAN